MEPTAALPIAMSNQHMPVCWGRWLCLEPGTILEKSSENHLCPAAEEMSFAFSQDSHFCSQPTGSCDVPSVGLDNTAIHFYAIFWEAPSFHRNTPFWATSAWQDQPRLQKGSPRESWNCSGVRKAGVPVTQCNRVSNGANILLPSACSGIFFKHLCTFS